MAIWASWAGSKQCRRPQHGAWQGQGEGWEGSETYEGLYPTNPKGDPYQVQARATGSPTRKSAYINTLPDVNYFYYINTFYIYIEILEHPGLYFCL